MERKQLALPWGGRVISEDGWSGKLRGAYIAPRSQQITHVLVQRGLFGHPAPVMLDGASQEGNDTLLLPTQRQASPPARGSVPFTPKTQLHCAGGDSAALRGLVLDRQRRRIEYLLVKGRKSTHAITIQQVQNLGSGSPSIALGRKELEQAPAFAADNEAQRNTVAALERADLTGDTFGAVHVQVVDGTAYLTGNVRLPVQKEDAEKAVASAKGVLNIQSAVATDWDVSLAIAQALAEHGLMRQGLVTVKSSLGRVALNGHLATLELVDSAVAVAAGAAGVCSIAHDIQVRPIPTQEPAPVADAH